MTAGKRTILSPGLHFIATPIGAARDITLRALDILISADVIAAEDTRSLRKLLDIHGIKLDGRPLIAYHDHNGQSQRPKLMQALEAGQTVVYASEAGTPLVADPGFQLGRAVIDAGFKVYSAPGPSAVLAALTVSGMPSDKFLFAGFAPNAKGARQTFLRELSEVPATLVLYESPKRILKFLADAVEIFGRDRPCVIARELTKKFEEVLRGSLAEIHAELSERSVKGEIVVLIGRGEKRSFDDDEVHQLLIDACETMRVKEAAALVAEKTGRPKRDLYNAALKLGKND